MNADDVYQRVVTTFGDASAVQVTTDGVDRWINDAQREIAVQANLLETRATSAFLDTETSKEFPPDLLGLISVWYFDGGSNVPIILNHLTFADVEQYAATEARGVPNSYS